jgi:hypothetical protein
LGGIGAAGERELGDVFAVSPTSFPLPEVGPPAREWGPGGDNKVDRGSVGDIF